MSPADILDWQRLVLADSRLDRGEKLLAISLALRINSGTGTCYPSIPRIAQDNGITERQVYRVLATLEATGHISREKHVGKLNVYRLATTQGVTLPSPLEATDTTQEDARPLTYMSPPPDIHVRGTPDIHVTQKEQIERANRKEEYAPALRDGRTPPVVADEEQPRKTPHRIPADWQPDAATRKWIADFGVTDSEAQPVITEFRQYWQGRTQKRTDWQLAFRRNGRAEGALVRLRDMKQRGTQGRPLEKARGPVLRDARAVLAEIGL